MSLFSYCDCNLPHNYQNLFLCYLLTHAWIRNNTAKVNTIRNKPQAKIPQETFCISSKYNNLKHKRKGTNPSRTRVVQKNLYRRKNRKIFVTDILYIKQNWSRWKAKQKISTITQSKRKMKELKVLNIRNIRASTSNIS